MHENIEKFVLKFFFPIGSSFRKVTATDAAADPNTPSSRVLHAFFTGSRECNKNFVLILKLNPLDYFLEEVNAC